MIVVEYRIDANDLLTPVGPGWATFARANGAPELVSPEPGRTIWSYMTADEVIQLWRLLVRRVRLKKRPMQFPLRCDGPDVRRLLGMLVTAQPADVVRFRSALVREEPRPEVPLLDARTTRDPAAPLARMCSWCGRFNDGFEWVQVEDYVRDRNLLLEPSMPAITHGICSTCADLAHAELGEA